MVHYTADSNVSQPEQGYTTQLTAMLVNQEQWYTTQLTEISVNQEQWYTTHLTAMLVNQEQRYTTQLTVNQEQGQATLVDNTRNKVHR